MTAPSRKNRLFRVFTRHSLIKFLAASVLTIMMSGCGKEPADRPQIAPAVSVYIVSSENIGRYLEFVARTEPFLQADLRARVEGEIIKREFKEGTLVQKDQLLIKIDPTEYIATLNQAKADLASNKVGAENAARNLKRGKEVAAKGYLSQSDLDKLITTASQSTASVQAAEAVLEKAQLNLNYTDIKAPFSGLIGKVSYDIGNIVGPQSNSLATLTVTDPIYVNFQLEENKYLDYLQKHPKNKGPEDVQIDISLRLPNNTLYGPRGRINFADTKIDQSTGTVGLRASFPNPDGLVLPGLFVTLITESREKQKMSLIPQVAVQENQQGKFVLVINKDNKVATRIVKLGRRINAMWAVESGLKSGEKIIIEGLQKVRPGVEVKPVTKIVDKISGAISSESETQNKSTSPETVKK